MYSTGGLARLRNRALSPRFLELSHDDFDMVRDSAAWGLTAIYEPRFRHRLATLACCDSSFLVREAVARRLMTTPDPIAQRLGHRYLPYKFVYTEAIQLTYLFEFSITATIVWLIGCASLYDATPDLGYLRLAVGGSAAVAVGVTWGGYLVRVTRPAEIVFLAALLPVVAASGWVLLLGRDGPSVQRRRAWLALVAACYLGFVLGFLKLWGFIAA